MDDGYIILDDDGWGYIILDDDGWGYTILDDDGRGYIILDDDGWGYIILDDDGRGYIILDDDGWGYIILDDDGWGYMILDDDGDGWLCFQISFSGCSKVTEKSLYYLTKVPGLPKLRRVLAHGTGISLAPEFVNVQARFCDTTRKNSPDNKPSK